MAYWGGFQEHLLVPAFPFEHVQNTSFGDDVMMLDTPAFQRTPQADFTPAAIAQSYLLSPETRNPGLGEACTPKALVFRSAPEASDISRNESHMNSVAFPIQVRYATAQDWERYRALFTRLYCDENMTLKDVMSIMKEKYGFNATYVSSISVAFTGAC